MRRGKAPRPLGEDAPESYGNLQSCEYRLSVAAQAEARPQRLRHRSGQQVVDERTGAVHDYTGKSDIYGGEILLPEGAPEWLGDRTSLWNEVERVEKRKDAQLSREVMRSPCPQS